MKACYINNTLSLLLYILFILKQNGISMLFKLVLFLVAKYIPKFTLYQNYCSKINKGCILGYFSPMIVEKYLSV